jgi:adenylate kinase
MRVRLMTYYRTTSPLIGYYYAKGKLHSVDGMGAVEAITGEITHALGLTGVRKRS